jgi:hypothetical protein
MLRVPQAILLIMATPSCGFNPLRVEFVLTKPSLKAATGYIRLKCFHLLGKQ